ncbi:hypothetical protein AYI68_g6225 [Smittium mucronatum]|uniref:Replication-associated protein n=1 Tax=Smittium mucronatum TaxID=133383 RepID=A0A1R0GS45_9FUNG|nr:hypothetical protein AYI68_g6225 [Smittium mucronatum]
MRSSSSLSSLSQSSSSLEDIFFPSGTPSSFRMTSPDLDNYVLAQPEQAFFSRSRVDIGLNSSSQTPIRNLPVIEENIVSIPSRPFLPSVGINNSYRYHTRSRGMIHSQISDSFSNPVPGPDSHNDSLDSSNSQEISLTEFQDMEFIHPDEYYEPYFSSDLNSGGTLSTLVGNRNMPDHIISTSSNNSFRLSGKKAIVVYPGILTDRDLVLNELLKKDRPIQSWCINLVNEENGEINMHVFLEFSTKVNIRNEGYFDILGIHGIAKTVKDKTPVLRKIFRNDDFLTNIKSDLVEEFAGTPTERILRSKSLQNSLKILLSDRILSRSLLMNPSRLFENIRKLTPRKNSDTELNLRFREVPQISIWDRKKSSLWLKGPPGTGKTTFAKSLFNNPLIVNINEALLNFNIFHDGIIFDDMNFTKYTVEFQIHMTDVTDEKVIKIGNSKINIPAETPRVFTSNVPIFCSEYRVRRRVALIKINSKLQLTEDGREFEEPNKLIGPESEFHQV